MSQFKRSDGRTTLYRHYDRSGVLLYVGIAIKAASRTNEHRRRSHWFYQIETIRLEHFETSADALAAEKVAIDNEKPLHNQRRDFAPLKERWIPERPSRFPCVVDGRVIEVADIL